MIWVHPLRRVFVTGLSTCCYRSALSVFQRHSWQNRFHSNFSFLSTMASHPMNGCCNPIDKTFRFITRTYLIFIVGIGCAYTKLRLHLWYDQRNSNSVLTWWSRQSLHTAWVLMYSDVIMGAMASLITGLTIVNSTVYSGADQRKHQSSASPVTGEWEFTGDRLIPCTNGQWRGKCFHFMTSSCIEKYPNHCVNCQAAICVLYLFNSILADIPALMNNIFYGCLS